MAGCVPCFIIPLLLFIFHRYIQPILLKFWNPWEKKPAENEGKDEVDKKCEFSCECAWMKKGKTEDNETVNTEKLKAS